MPLIDGSSVLSIGHFCLSSSMAGLLIVNQEVPGSNPGGGAKGRLPSTVMGWLAEPRRPKGHAGSNPASSVVS